MHVCKPLVFYDYCSQIQPLYRHGSWLNGHRKTSLIQNFNAICYLSSFLSCLVGPLGFFAETWCFGQAMAMAVRIRSQPVATVCRLIPLNCLSQHKLLKNHQIL